MPQMFFFPKQSLIYTDFHNCTYVLSVNFDITNGNVVISPISVPFVYKSISILYLWVGVGGFSNVVATFNYVGESFNQFMATTEDVWIIPSFRSWDYVHVEHISCVITNYGQHHWVIPSPLLIALLALLEENTTRKLLSLSLDLFFKILLFEVAFLILFSVAIFSSYFLLVGLLLQYVALFQSRELVKYLEWL